MSSRLIDPRRHIERGTDEAHGLLSARELDKRIDTSNKIDADFDRNQRFIAQETIEVFCPKPGAGVVEVQMSHLILNGPLNAVGMISRDLRMSHQCRLTHLRFMGSAFLTAGFIVPKLRVYEAVIGAGSIDYEFDEVTLDSGLDDYGAQNATKTVFFDWHGAIQIARDERWRFFVRTSSDFAPTDTDFKAAATFSYDQWI